LKFFPPNLNDTGGSKPLKCDVDVDSIARKDCRVIDWGITRITHAGYTII